MSWEDPSVSGLRTAHVDRLDMMALGVHLIQDVASLQRDSLEKLNEQHQTLLAPFRPTSKVTWNFIARSPTPLSNVRPMNMPRIVGSASGERLPNESY